MIKKRALAYLKVSSKSLETEKIIDECLEEVKKIARPKIIIQSFKLEKHEKITIVNTNIELTERPYSKLLDGFNNCLLLAVTLGFEIDQRIKFYQQTNISKAVVFDAVSSAYVEEVADKEEEQLNIIQRTRRFCPGYQRTSLGLNKDIIKVLQADKKIGLTLGKDSLMTPLKSMVGIIGYN
ncbi:MAG: ABC transporter substrate-binding protein [Bacilli bacterium]